MNRVLPRLAALLPLLWLSSVGALGLGEIDVRSRLNQRFTASIPLSALAPDEATSIRVALASPAEFQRAGIERTDFLSSLKFTVVDGAAPRIEIASDQIVREPYLSLLLDVRASSGRILREFTVLLDPPEVAARSIGSASSFYETAEEARQAMPAAPAPAPRALEPAPAPAPAAAAPTAMEQPQPAEPATAAPPVASDGRYGPVQNGETFWSIAKRLRPDESVTMDQMLLAIYRANPGAFDGFNGLRRGATLDVPDLATIRATSAADAKQEVARLRGLSGSAARRPAAATVAPAPVYKPEPITLPPPKVEAPPPAPAPEPQASAPEPATAVEAAAPATESTTETPAAGTVADAPAEPSAATAEPATEPAVAEAPAAAAEEEVVSAPIVREEERGLLESLLIPLIIGLLLLGAVGFGISKLLAARRERKEAEAAFAAPRMRIPGREPADLSAPVVAAAAAKRPSAKEELERLQESLDEGPAASTQNLSTQRIDSVASTQVVPPADATQVFEVPPPAPAPAPAAAEVDFDLTGQFEAQTVQINLDANDPVSEADFHLAYGLYDEAALLLKQAAAKEPSRTDIQVKLAETYFAAGKAAEFRQVAEALKGKAAAADWQKIGIMGQQLSPGDALYAGSGEQAPADMSVDMSFDEPAAAAPAAPAAETFSPRAEADATLDFKLEDLELPSLDQDELPPAHSAPAKPADNSNAVEFDLSGFDLGGGTPEPAPAPQPAAPADGNLLDFDLGDATAEPSLEPSVESAAAPEPEALNLDEFELGDLGSDSSTISGDEAGTKLDLARAYVDMGDNEMARTLLNEVLEQGNEQQQSEARALIGRLG